MQRVQVRSPVCADEDAAEFFSLMTSYGDLMVIDMLTDGGIISGLSFLRGVHWLQEDGEKDKVKEKEGGG